MFYMCKCQKTLFKLKLSIYLPLNGEQKQISIDSTHVDKQANKNIGHLHLKDCTGSKCIYNLKKLSKYALHALHWTYMCIYLIEMLIDISVIRKIVDLLIKSVMY